MTGRRGLWLAIGLGLVFLALGFVAILMRQPEPLPAYSAVSTAPSGSAALAEWLIALDYDVVTEPQPRFSAPNPDEVLVVLEPITLFTEAEWQTLERGLKGRGGRVLIVGEGLTTHAAFRRFGFDIGPSRRTLEAATLPVLIEPAFTRAITTTATLDGSRADAVALVDADGAPAAVAFPLGRGSVTLATTIRAFSNDGLRDEELARLTLNLITATGPRRIRFDEWHLGRRAALGAPQSEIVGPEAWLLRTPSGQGVLLLVVLSVVTLWLSGRPFGRPIPLPAERVRRTPLEYVNAVAQLNRRAGHRRAAADDYSARLKRVIGQRYRIDPTLSDADFLARLSSSRPQGADGELEGLLGRLSTTHDEAELLRLANTAARRLAEETRHS